MSGEPDDLVEFEERIGLLRDAYHEYMAAEFGELNMTADKLRDAAHMCGWQGGGSPLPWVRETLEIEP